MLFDLKSASRIGQGLVAFAVAVCMYPLAEPIMVHVIHAAARQLYVWGF
jgi:hypothetical protein